MDILLVWSEEFTPKVCISIYPIYITIIFCLMYFYIFIFILFLYGEMKIMDFDHRPFSKYFDSPLHKLNEKVGVL